MAKKNGPPPPKAGPKGQPRPELPKSNLARRYVPVVRVKKRGA